MGRHLNDPKIDKRYNYLYKITNNINGKIYIGVHRTDKLDDGYMGSGKILKMAQEKYGIENFSKHTLEFFETYREALDKEREIVTLTFIEDSNNYNLKEGGYGNCQWSSDMIKFLSESSYKRWEDLNYRQRMEQFLKDPIRCDKISKGVRKWIKDNPEKHILRMGKINKTPEKIEKMANTHRGMKRSNSAKTNISNGIRDAYRNNPNGPKSKGSGMIYIYNSVDNISKRQEPNLPIPDGWVRGSGPKPDGRYLNLNKGSVFAYDPTIKKNKRFKNLSSVPNNYIIGKIQYT